MKQSLISLFMLLSALCFADNDEARLLRFPSVGGDKIAFTYAGDLYSVSIDGGVAVKMTSDIGFEMFSRFSPDGKTIAFTAQYDGNTEVYTMPTEGGTPKRLTFTATLDRDDIGDRMGPNNIVMCWTPDGKEIVFRTRWYTFSGLRGLLYQVPVNGGDIKQIPTTEGGFCSYSPDDKKLAMNRMFREFRTWKYYRGGQADDIWINTVGTTKLENITNNDAQDIFPMWIGKEIYFFSDRDGIMNLFCYNTSTKETAKMTRFDVYDCKFPSYSKDYVVFENGGYIYKFSVADKKCEKVPVTIKDEALYARSKFSQPLIGGGGRGMSGRAGYGLSPDGERVLAIVRGDIFSIPATIGATYNLSNSPESHEKDAVWSPDGKNIAFFSDASGEYQAYIIPYDRPEEKTMLTNFPDGYPSNLAWSPDSKKLYFTTDRKEFYSLDVASKNLKKIFQGEYGAVRGFDISSDGKWITYATSGKNNVSIINIYDVAKDEHHTVTTPWYDSYSPIFSQDGKYLFFTSARDFQARYSDVEWNAAYDISSFVFVLPLAKDTPNPVIIKGDEFKVATNAPEAPAKGGKDAKDNKESRKGKDATPEKPAEKPATNIVIDFDGIVERAAALPLGSGSYQLIASDGKDLFFYEGSEMKKISMKDMEVTPVTKSRIMAATPDGKKALIGDKGKLYVVDAPAFRSGEKAVPVEDAKVLVDYHKEWKQIFDETWRIYRDGFFVKNMVGRDWNAIKAKYEALLPYVNHRQDLTYIIGEMIAELNTGHCYVTTGEAPQPERIKTGLLGGQFSKDKSGFFRIDKIFEGVSWGNAQRSPLGEPGLGVKVGDYILEINGISTKNLNSIFEALIGKVGVVTALKVNGTPSDKGAKTIYVKPIADESQLAYYEWVQNNIRKVEKASNGEIGYIHIPDMSVAGLDEFTKLFYSQLDKKALIIDDRMNGGGNVSPMILERLQRVAYRVNMSRNGSTDPTPVPNATHVGPKVCLVDKYSSSDGDLFPYGFQQLKLGPVIGVRTWGGIVGISGSKPYVDGQQVTTPFFTSYSTDGKWIIENHGVDPDIIVDINPFEDFKGNDAQLNKAIEILKEQLKTYTPLPTMPADPVR